MRILNPKSRPLLLFVLLASAAYGQEIPQAIDLQAKSSTYDRNSGHLVCEGVTISQGEMSVSANSAEATELEFENAAWISGQPATINWESSENDEAIFGQASELVYNREAGTLSLTGDAVLRSGISEVSGNTLLYDFNAEQVVAGSPDDASQGVRITITPEETGANELTEISDKEPTENSPAESALAREDEL